MKCVIILFIVRNIFNVFMVFWTIKWKGFVFEASVVLSVGWLSPSSPHVISIRKNIHTPSSLITKWNKLKQYAYWFQFHMHNVNWTSNATRKSNRTYRNCDTLVSLFFIGHSNSTFKTLCDQRKIQLQQDSVLKSLICNSG